MGNYSEVTQRTSGGDGNVLILNTNGEYMAVSFCQLRYIYFNLRKFYLKKISGAMKYEGIYRQNKNGRIIDEAG